MMNTSVRNQPTAERKSIVPENLRRENNSETAVEWVLSTSETVGVNVFPPHLRETSLDMWLHSSTKDITDPISNTIVSSCGTTASFVDGHISSFVDNLKQVDFDNLLAEHHDRNELFEERSLTSEKPASSSSSKSFEVLKWVANQEQNSNEHLLKRLNSLDIDIDVHSIGRTMNKSNSQESHFYNSGSVAASETSHVDNTVNYGSENEARNCQDNGKEFEMLNGCYSTCIENIRKHSASSSCLTQSLLIDVSNALEAKFEAFRGIIKTELGKCYHPDLPPKWFLEYMEAVKLNQSFGSQLSNPQCHFNHNKEEVAFTVIDELRQQMASQVRKMDEFLEKAESDKQQSLRIARSEQQATEIRLQNALTELEVTRVETAKVQRESTRNTANDLVAITNLRNELSRLQNELTQGSSKHAEEISSLEEKNIATVHALEQTRVETSQLKSSLQSALLKNKSALVQLAKVEGQLREALDRENFLKHVLQKLQNQLSSVMEEKDKNLEEYEEYDDEENESEEYDEFQFSQIDLDLDWIAQGCRAVCGNCEYNSDVCDCYSDLEEYEEYDDEENENEEYDDL